MPVFCYQHLFLQFSKSSLFIISLIFATLTGSTGFLLDDCSNKVWDNARISWGGCRAGRREGSFVLFFVFLIYGNINAMVLFQMLCKCVLSILILLEICWIHLATTPRDLRMGPFGPWVLGGSIPLGFIVCISLLSNMMSIKFLTWNVRGLRNKIKRSAALSLLKKQWADVTVLVETHVEGRLQQALRHPWVGWAYHSTHTPYAQGVSVLVAKSVHFELCDILTTPKGDMSF